MKKGLLGLLLVVLGLATLHAQDVSSRRAQISRSIASTILGQDAEKLNFFQAILDNDLKAIDEFLAMPKGLHNANVSLTKREGLPFLQNGKRYNLPTGWANGSSRTPLMVAAEVGALEVVAKLLSVGANVNKTLDENWTPLCFATKGTSLESDKRFLLEQTLSGRKNQTLGQRQAEVVKLLLRVGADPAKACGNKNQVSPLYMAVEKPEYLDIVKILGRELKKIDELDSFAGEMKDNPLTHAVWAGNKDAMVELLKLGAKADGQYSQYDKMVVSPAFQAVYSNRLDMLKILIEDYQGCACAYYDNVEHEWLYAVEEAERLGYTTIANYLRSQGYGSSDGD